MISNSPALALLLLLTGTACVPKGGETREGTQLTEEVTENRKRTEAPTPPTLTSASPRKPCGLPESIRKPDWPRRLTGLSATEPTPFEPGSVTLAVLPDTQYYVSCREPHLARQAEWVQQVATKRNIVAALHLGDITESNTRDEWEIVASALHPVAETLPLILASGNHDFGKAGSANTRTSLFREFFGKPGRATGQKVAAQMEEGSVENAYFRLPQSRFTLGVLTLEWSPRKRTVAWAKETLSRYLDDRVVFITHAYLYHDATRYDFHKKGTEQDWNPLTYGTARRDLTAPYSEENATAEGAYDGEMLWNDLLKDIPGLFLTMNGHVLADGEAVLTSQGTHGNLVHQVLANYQMLDEGGLGFLRLVELLSDGTTLRMKTYSPSLDRFATEATQNFSLPLTPPLF